MDSFIDNPELLVDKLPDKKGAYWFYGKLWGSDEPELNLMEVWEISYGMAYIMRGHFVYKEDMKDYKIIPATVPEVFKDKQINYGVR